MPRQRGLYGQLSLSRLPPPAWCWFPHPEVMPWGPLELRSSHKPSLGGGWESPSCSDLCFVSKFPTIRTHYLYDFFKNIINPIIPPGMVVGVLIRETVDSWQDSQTPQPPASFLFSPSLPLNPDSLDSGSHDA